MATSTTIFAYASLDSKQADSFRLLSLLPGLNNSPIECTLRHTRRSAPFQPYEALSYAWGDPNLTNEILVNGLPLSITQNLEHALRSLRQDSGKDGAARTLWVDAICIDQSHVFERNHQVAQMREIYAGVERVVIWLGDTSDDSGMAIAFMWEVYERLAANGEFSGYNVLSGQYLEKDFRDGIHEFLARNLTMNGKRWLDSCLGIGGNELGSCRSLLLQRMQYVIVAKRHLHGLLCAQTLTPLETAR